MTIPDIYSAFDIGNLLDIKIRLSPDTNHSFVKLFDYIGKTDVKIDVNNDFLADFILKLESFDNNSSVKATLKTDEIRFMVITMPFFITNPLPT